MYFLPDLSYFAIPGIINQMRRRSVYTTSLFLLNGRHDEWDITLSDENPSLYNWLHNRSGDLHDIYMPFPVPSQFLKFTDFNNAFKSFIEPAKSRIITYLNELGVEDVEEYMSDSDEWLKVGRLKPPSKLPQLLALSSLPTRSTHLSNPQRPADWRKRCIDFALEFGAIWPFLNMLYIQNVMPYFVRFLDPGISDLSALALTATEPRDSSLPESGGKILRP